MLSVQTESEDTLFLEIWSRTHHYVPQRSYCVFSPAAEQYSAEPRRGDTLTVVPVTKVPTLHSASFHQPQWVLHKCQINVKSPFIALPAANR